MKKPYRIKNILQMICGFFIFALGIMLTVKADFGLAPWDVFHISLSEKAHLTFGTIVIIVGTLIIIVNWLFKEKIGVGTIFNVFMIGWFIDIINYFNFIPTPQSYIIKLIMIIAGLFVMGIGSYFYLSTGLGTGPRDGLMIIIAKLSKKPIGFGRTIIEVSVLIIGYFLGSKVGIGTVIMALFTGIIIQTVFRIFKFNPKKIEHKYLV